MKAKFTIWILAAAALLVSCSQDDAQLRTTENMNDELKPVSFSVTLPGEAMKTRSVSATDDEDATRAYLEIWQKNADGTYAAITEGMLAGVKPMTKGSDGSFALSGIYLDPVEDYRFLFWADNAPQTATTPTDLENVEYADGSIAFATVMNWEKKNTVNATLKHVVSKVTLKTTTDIMGSKLVDIAIPTTYTAYDVNTLSAKSAASEAKEFEIETPTEITGTPEGTEVFSFYALVDEGVQELTVSHDNYTLQVSNVPLAPNKHTVLVGDVRYIGWTETTFTAGFDETWGGGETTIPIEGYTVAENGTYTVYNLKGLQAWADYVKAGNYSTGCTLAADITLDKTQTNNWTPVSNHWNYRYTGTFNGAGHTISGLNINLSYSYGGFIAYLGRGGKVENLAITDASITGSQEFVGGIVGSVAEGPATIVGCRFVGNVVSSNRAAGAGGIAGNLNSGCTISGCSSSGTVGGESTYYSGGICGTCWGNITASWSTATVTSYQFTGGIIGFSNNATCKAAYYNSSAEKAVGGIYQNTTDPTSEYTAKVDTWDDAADAMNAALTEGGYGLQWVANTGADKTTVPLVPLYK